MPYGGDPRTMSQIGAQTGRAIRGVDRMRTMANMAASQMESIGSPQAQQWAQRIRQSPEEAFAMAQQFGGLAQIEQSLRGSQAAGQADAALRQASSGSNLTPMQFELLRQYGPEGFKQYMEATESGETFDMGAADKIRRDYTKRSENFLTIQHFYEQAAANAAQAAKDPLNPGAVDFALVQTYGKMLDPNSVVRNEEGRFIVESQSSTARDAINRFARLFSSAGELNPQARFNLMRQIEATYRQAAESQSRLLEDMSSELGRLGAKGKVREYAMPIGIQPSGRSLDLAPWKEASGSFIPGSSATPLPAEDSELVDGRVYETKRGKAKWNEAERVFEAIDDG